MERKARLRLCMLRQLAAEAMPQAASSLWHGINTDLVASIQPDRMGLSDFRVTVDQLVARAEAHCERQPRPILGGQHIVDTWSITEPGRRALILASLALRR